MSAEGCRELHSNGRAALDKVLEATCPVTRDYP